MKAMANISGISKTKNSGSEITDSAPDRSLPHSYKKICYSFLRLPPKGNEAQVNKNQGFPSRARPQESDNDLGAFI